MGTFAKGLVVISVLVSWGAVFFIQKVFELESLSVEFFLWLLFVFLIWLIPYSLLILFFPPDWLLILSFIVGGTGFFISSWSFYTMIGFALLVLGFWYWRVRVKLYLENAQALPLTAPLAGISFFLTILSLFMSILYFNSPLAQKTFFEPKIPEKIFDTLYDPLSQTILRQIGGDALREGVLPPPEIKKDLYESLNTMLKDISIRYQRYVPFFFAAGVFLSLNAFFVPFKYLLLAMVILFTKLFLIMGWLHKETVQVPKEVIKF